MSSFKWETTSAASILTTDLNSLANAAAALSAAVDNSGLYLWGDFELVATWGTNPTDFALVELYLVRSVDGTNYEDASTTGPILARNGFIGGFPVRAVTTAQRIIIPQVPLPPADFKILLVNKVGQTMAASGNTLKMKPYRQQAV